MKRICVFEPTKMEGNECAGTSEVRDIIEACLVLRKTKEDLKRPPPTLIVLNKPKVTIGRNYNVDYCILSQAISRIHCEICSLPASPDEWELIDKSSGNGVFVNGIKIQREKGHRLLNGDVVDLASTEDPIASYVFKCNVKRERAPEKTCKKPKFETDLLEPTQSTSLAREAGVAPTTHLDGAVTPERAELRRKNDDLAEELQKMKDIMKAQELALRQQWEREQEEKKKAEEAHAEECKRNEALEEEKWQLKLTELNAKHATALEEKSQLAERLKTMSDNKSKEAEIEKEKARLEEELRKKDDECAVMKQRLNELTSRNEESEALAIKIRDDLIKNVNDTMENELQCSICSELFVKAATLNCAHSYCSYCINEWKQKKPECPICRQRITSVTPSLVLDNFIEKIVETLDTSMRERRKELLEERSKLPAQNVARNTVIVIPDVTAQARGGSARGTRARRRTRGQPARARTNEDPMQAFLRNPSLQVVLHPRLPPPHRVGVGGNPHPGRPQIRPLMPVPVSPTNHAQARPRNPFPHGVQPIEISSESPSDEEEVDNVRPYGYYGGHGFCYRCGRGGHWANGCPY